MASTRGWARLSGIAALALSLAVAGPACGGDDEENGDGGSGGTGGSGGSGGSGGDAFTVNAALGLTVVEDPFADEAPFGGAILVLRGEDAVSGATVTVNGVTVPEDEFLPGFYTVDAVTVPVAAGDTVAIAASEGADTATLALACPSVAAIASPAEGAAVAPGATVTVTWTGELFYDGVVYHPMVLIRGFDPIGNTVDPAAPGDQQQAEITRGATSVTVVAPETELAGYVIDLLVPGDFTVDVLENGGICFFRARAHLEKT